MNRPIPSAPPCASDASRRRFLRRALAVAPLLGMLLAGCGREGPMAPEPASFTASSSSQADQAVAAGSSKTTMVTPPQWCVVLDDGADAQAVAQTHGLRLLRWFPLGDLALYEGNVDPTVLRDDPQVRLLQFNEETGFSRPVEVTLGFHEGDWVDGTVATQNALAALSLDKVHRRVRGRGVRVAVLDTGVDPQHPLLVGRVEPDPSPTPILGSFEVGNGIDDDGDGLVDEAYGHGTHIAGLVAAVAPDVTILSYRVLNDDGVGTAFDLAMGLYLALERGANVVNLSLVLSGETEVVHDALRVLEEAGVVIVAAAGNTGGPVAYPATDSHTLSIAAVDAAGVVAPFSARDDARLAAPGVAVESAFPGGGSALGSGTSMACGVVSGCVAVLAETPAGPQPERAVAALRETALPIVPQKGIRDGRVSPLSALKLLRAGRTDQGPRLHMR